MTAPDHDRIWLEPKCAEKSYEGRQWCQDDVWDHCEECDLPSVEYVRADLLDAAVGAALAEAAEAAWPHDWQPDHILSRTNYMLFCAAKNILALRKDALTALDRAKREARVEVVAALQELTEVAERAIRLSQDHSDFHLYAMEPMWQAIAAARALIEKEGKPQP